jgi:hypothetical protein
VVRDILLLISGSLEDGVEGIVTNNLSEGLESNGLNNILGIGWVDLEGDGLNLIDWDIDILSESIEWIGFGGNELSLGWSSGGVLLVMLVVLVVLLVLLKSRLIKSSLKIKSIQCKIT